MSGFYGIVTWRSTYDDAHRHLMEAADGNDFLDDAEHLAREAVRRANTATERELALGLVRTVQHLRVEGLPGRENVDD